MNAHLKTKTSFRSKLSALLSLFTMLSIAPAWGQTVEVINMTNSSETIEMDCSTNYKLVLSNQNGNRTYTFTNPNGAIKKKRKGKLKSLSEVAVSTQQRKCT